MTTISQSIYTKDQAVAEIMALHMHHITLDRSRITRYNSGAMSTRQKQELEARDRRDMADLVRSFFYEN